MHYVRLKTASDGSFDEEDGKPPKKDILSKKVDKEIEDRMLNNALDQILDKKLIKKKVTKRLNSLAECK